MTRKEQITEAAKKFWIVEDEISDVATFQKGAEWADSHPHWHKYPDEKPSIKNIWSNTVLIALKEEDIPTKSCLHRDTTVWYSEEYGHIDSENVIAWTELPKPPKFN